MDAAILIMGTALLVAYASVLGWYMIHDLRLRTRNEREAARRHADQLEQWNEARGIMMHYTEQIAHVGQAMLDVSKALRENNTCVTAALRQIVSDESYFRLSDDAPPAAERGFVAAPPDTISDLPPILPYDPSVSDCPTLRSGGHPDTPRDETPETHDVTILSTKEVDSD